MRVYLFNNIDRYNRNFRVFLYLLSAGIVLGAFYFAGNESIYKYNKDLLIYFNISYALFFVLCMIAVYYLSFKGYVLNKNLITNFAYPLLRDGDIVSIETNDTRKKLSRGYY